MIRLIRLLWIIPSWKQIFSTNFDIIGIYTIWKVFVGNFIKTTYFPESYEETKSLEEEHTRVDMPYTALVLVWCIPLQVVNELFIEILNKYQYSK